MCGSCVWDALPTANPMDPYTAVRDEVEHSVTVRVTRVNRFVLIDYVVLRCGSPTRPVDDIYKHIC